MNATSVSVVYFAIESVKPIELRLVLDQLNVFGTRTFWSLSDVEGDFLAFTQIIEVSAFDRRAVKEHVLVAVRSRDEAESFVGNAFDRALFHFSYPVLL